MITLQEMAVLKSLNGLKANMSVFAHIYDDIVQKRTYTYSKIRKHIRITQVFEMR